MTDPYATPEPSEQSASPSVDPSDEPTAPVVFGASVFGGPTPEAPTMPPTPAYPSAYPAAYPAA